MKLRTLAVTLALALTSAAWAAPYATTGAGSSTIGTSGDYATLADAAKAISGSVNDNVVTNKVVTAGVATLQLQNANTFAVGDQINVALTPPDTNFDGTFNVTAVSANSVSYSRSYAITNRSLASNVATVWMTTAGGHGLVVGQSIVVAGVDATFNGTYTATAHTGVGISYAKTNANVTNGAAAGGATVRLADVASAASGGTVYKINGSGTRDASAWTFLIQNDLTERLNSEIRCTVASGGSITFKPAPGVKPTVTWANTIPGNLGSSGHVVIGMTIGGTPNAYTATNNIIFDGSNTVGGKSRDLTLTNQANDAEQGIFLRIRGNNDGVQFKNLNAHTLSTLASSQIITFTSDATAPGAPDNWVVDNCLINAQASSSGEPIRSTNSGTVTAQSGWTISNNTLLGTTRGIFLNHSAGGSVSKNLIRMTGSGGFVGAAIYHLSAGATAGTINIDGNQLDLLQQQNTNADNGISGIWLSPPATVACTYNVTNNVVGGWIFTSASTYNQIHRGIVVNGAALNNANTTVNVEHNSINMSNATKATGATADYVFAIGRIGTGTPAVMNLRNNLIRFTPTGTLAYAINVSVAGTFTADGNAIWAPGAKIGRVAGSTFPTWGNWQSGAYDANGQNIDPTATTGGAWASAADGQPGDLHFTGTPVELVNSTVATTFLTDMDGETRVSGAALPGADVPNAASTYTWQAASGNVGDSGNWSPARTSPKTNDILVVDGGVQASPAIAFQDTKVGGFKLINNAAVSLTGFGPSANRLLVVDGGAGADFSVANGSSLTISGGTAIVVDIAGSATGSVLGDVLVKSDAGVANRLISRTAGALVFGNGSTMAVAPNGSGSGSVFGAASPLEGAGGNAANLMGTVFQNGSTYHSGADKAGTRGTSSPSNPFGLAAGSSMVDFQANSTFVSWLGTPVAAGRTYGGNLVLRNSDNVSIGGGNPFTVSGTLSTQPSLGVTQGVITTTGAGATVIGGNLVVNTSGPTLNLSGATGGYSVGGNIDVQDALLFVPPSTTLTLNGTGLQTVEFGGSATLAGLTVSNAAGVFLGFPVNVTGLLTLTNGVVNSFGNLVTAGDVARTSGYIVGGPLRRAITATTGARVFPVGTASGYTPVSVDFTVASSGAGTLTVTPTTGDHPNVVDASKALNQYWTLTPAGLADFTASLVFSYQDTDVSGNEAAYVVGKYDGVNRTIVSTVLDTSANTASVSGITSFSDWTLGEAAALPVAVSGFSID